MVSAHDRRSSLNVSPLADVVAPWSGVVPVEVRPSPPLLSSKVNVEGNRADALRPPNSADSCRWAPSGLGHNKFRGFSATARGARFHSPFWEETSSGRVDESDVVAKWD